MKKRVISLILAGCMIFTAIPCEVYADKISQVPDITVSATGTATEGLEISGNTVTRYTGTATDVVIPEGITTIGIMAFRDCTNLKSITIPQSVDTIGDFAFSGCSKLESIEIPSGVTTIMSAAFENCSNLESITIPQSVDTIGDNAFRGCSKVKNIEIPSGITAIECGTFMGCSNLESIEIPKGVTTIGEYAFYSCSKLESIVIPEGVTAIAESTFGGCSKLESITIPSGVTTIGVVAFAECNSLESVKIPQSVTTIDEQAFTGCSKLKITGRSGSYAETYAKAQGISFEAIYLVTFDANGGMNLSESQREVKEGEQIGTLPTVERAGCNLKGWYTKAAGGIKVAETDMMQSNTTLYAQWEIPLKNTVVTLSNTSYTYDGIAKKPAVTVKINGQVLQKDRDYTVTYAKNQEAGTAQVVVTGTGSCSGTVTKNFSIGAASLKNAKVTLSNTSYTYNGKAKTPGITVKLGNKTLSKDKDYTVTYKKNKNIGTASVTVTGKNNYSGTLSRTFTIKAGKNFNSGKYKYKVTGTSTVAFNGIVSTKTTKVTIPSTVKYGGKTFKVTSVAGSALKGKTKVTQVTVGKNVKTIGASAFNQCKSLKNITIESTKLKSVGKKAFQGISSKAKIKVPKKKLSTYQKLLKGKGQGNKVKIVKK